MELVLLNGKRATIDKKSCGFETDDTRIWDIDPLTIIACGRKEGLFVLGAKYGSKRGDYAGRMIPVSSVLYIDRPSEW